MPHEPVSETQSAQALLNKLVRDYLSERQREKKRRWIKRVVVIGLIVAGGFFLHQQSMLADQKPHVGIVDIHGEMFDNKEAGADNVVKGLSKAYESKGLKALILRINSPGGSPVQADYIYNKINYLREKHKKIPVYAVCVDTCASAAYYVAAAAESIYANPSSMVGSIGVLYNGFGFVDIMQKLGVKRRLQTAGKNKGFLDPFSPIAPEQEQDLQTMLAIVHEQFITQVKKGRGARLHVDDDTFSGLIWTGVQAKERGLIDGFASAGVLARDVIHCERVVNYTNKESMFEQVAKNIGEDMLGKLPTLLGLHQGLQ